MYIHEDYMLMHYIANWKIAARVDLESLHHTQKIFFVTICMMNVN